LKPLKKLCRKPGTKERTSALRIEKLHSTGKRHVGFLGIGESERAGGLTRWLAATHGA
jgi:hypothetical protein